MNHDYTRAGGIWTSLTDLLASELADLDAKTVDSISATGGVYSLTGDMAIGGAPGADWTFDLPTTFTDEVSVQAHFSVFGGVADFVNGINCYSDLNVNGIATFEGDAAFNNPARFYDPAYFNSLAQFLGNCEMFGNVYMGNTSGDFLLVSATADFEGPVSFNDPAHAYDTWTFHDATAFQAGAAFNGGNVTFLSATTLGVPLQFTLEGRIPERYTVGSNTNSTYSPRNYDHVYVPNGGIDADRSYEIDDTGAIDGDRMRFTNADVGNFIFVKTGGVTIVGIKFITDTPYWCDVQRMGGVWRLVASGPRFT